MTTCGNQIEINFDEANDLIIECIGQNEYEIEFIVDDHPFTKLTAAQYEELKTNGQLSNQMLYLITD